MCIPDLLRPQAETANSPNARQAASVAVWVCAWTCAKWLSFISDGAAREGQPAGKECGAGGGDGTNVMMNCICVRNDAISSIMGVIGGYKHTVYIKINTNNSNSAGMWADPHWIPCHTQTHWCVFSPAIPPARVYGSRACSSSADDIPFVRRTFRRAPCPCMRRVNKKPAYITKIIKRLVSCSVNRRDGVKCEQFSLSRFSAILANTWRACDGTHFVPSNALIHSIGEFEAKSREAIDFYFWPIKPSVTVVRSCVQNTVTTCCYKHRFNLKATHNRQQVNKSYAFVECIHPANIMFSRMQGYTLSKLTRISSIQTLAEQHRIRTRTPSRWMAHSSIHIQIDTIRGRMISHK